MEEIDVIMEEMAKSGFALKYFCNSWLSYIKFAVNYLIYRDLQNVNKI